MIYYFSGTGNSLRVARELSERLSLPLSSVAAAKPCEGELALLVFPVYAWGIPSVMSEFVATLSAKECPKTVVAVITCGDDMGYADRVLERELTAVGWHLDGAFSVVMCDTYICLPGFDVDSPELLQKKENAITPCIDRIAAHILAHRYHEKGDLERGACPWLKTYVLRPLFNRFLINYKRFYVDSDKCRGCGRCAKLCPLQNIVMNKDKRPEWHAHCTHCLRCYHCCPSHAVGYGKFTKGKGQVKINI